MEKDTSPDGGGYGDLGDATFIPGVDLVSPWREANEAAEELNAALEALGVHARFLRAVAHVGPRGEPVVWLRPESGRLVARRLRGSAAVPGARVVDFRRVADDREGELGHGAA